MRTGEENDEQRSKFVDKVAIVTGATGIGRATEVVRVDGVYHS